MKLIRFLKPDLKRIIILLIILSPVILFTFSLPAQFYLWDNLYNQLGVIVIIPFIIVSMIFFGGFDTGGGLFQSLAYSNISTLVTYLIGIVFWYVISCVIATGWNLLFKSFGKNSKTYEKAIVISFFTIFAVLVIIMPSIATYYLVTEKTTRQNISMDELVFFRDPETQQIRGDVRLQEIKLKNNFIFPASYQLPDVTACLYDSERNLNVGYSVAYKTEDSRFIGDLAPTHRDIIAVQPNTETKIYLCRFTGTDGANYEDCDQLLLLSNVGMNNYSYCDYVTEEDTLHSEKIKILE